MSHGRRVFEDSSLYAYASNPLSPKGPNLFDQFRIALTGMSPNINTNYSLRYLLPQIISGHRLWADAVEEPERFIALNEIQIMSMIVRTSSG